jgi:hypothetical protein
MRNLVRLCSMLLLCTPAFAQESVNPQQIEETFDKIRSFMELEREELISDELQLSRREARAFWEVYEDYREEYDVWQQRYADLLVQFVEQLQTMSDDQAQALLREYFDIKAGALDVRRRYVSTFEEVISPRDLVRLYQIENKVDAVAETPLVFDIPLLEAGAGNR